MKIYLDFIGTILEQSDANCRDGRVNFGCFEVIKKLQDAGHSFILNTSNTGESLKKTLKLINEDSWMFFKNRRTEELEIQPILEVVKEKIPANNWDWEQMIKEQLMFIDDWTNNIPVKKCCMTYGFMVDWDELDKQFIEHNLYNQI
jgi:hydroxymethylpyrimidine pyrophosphatase-like HAD family hydrolase